MHEKELTAGEYGGFRGSAVLIDSVVSPAGPTAAQWMLIVKDANGKERWSVTVMISPKDPVAAAQAAVEQLVPKLTNAPPAGALDPQKEAAEYYRKGSELVRFGRAQEALPMLETAHALAPQNAEYGAAKAAVAFGVRLGAGEVDLANAELTELERYLSASIEAGDIKALSAWPLQPRPLTFYPYRDADIELAGRVHRMTRRLVDALKTQQDRPGLKDKITWIERGLDSMVDGFRARFSDLERKKDRLSKEGRSADAQAVQSVVDRYLAALEPLRAAPAHVNLRVRMLLTRKEWPVPWHWDESGGPYARVRCDNGLIWLALTDLHGMGVRNPRVVVGFTGLDPKAKEPDALWQATLVLSAMGGVDWLGGIALGKDHSYVALGGPIEFPGTTVKGTGVLQDPRVLGTKDGLPASAITAIAGDPESMWVGFGGGHDEKGLGLYNTRTAEWKPCFSSLGKGGDFSPGHPYAVTEINLGPETVFCCAAERLWEFEPQSGSVHPLATLPDICFLSTGTADEACFHCRDALLCIEPNRKGLGLAVHDTVASDLVTMATDQWNRVDDTFSPPDDQRRLDAWQYGGIDMVTAAIHGDQLWARSGKSQIAILHRGQKLEDATKINNDILDGGPVLQFFETPYGLLAVGEGSAGLIESEPGE